VGRTHIVLKSLVSPGKAYIIRGVDMTEIVPQNIKSRNFARSDTSQSVRAAITPIAARAMAGMIAT
jgi:hypothetical protein